MNINKLDFTQILAIYDMKQQKAELQEKGKFEKNAASNEFYNYALSEICKTINQLIDVIRGNPIKDEPKQKSEFDYS